MLEEPVCPLGICVTCTSSAVAAQQYRLLVHSSNKLWIRAVENLETIPQPVIASQKSLYAFVCQETLQVQALKDFSGDDTKTVLNRLAGKGPKKREPSGNKSKKPRAPRTGPTCVCNDCGQQFPGPYYLNAHLKNSGQKEACVICGTVLIRGREMKDHLASIHGEITFLCPQCPLLFNRELELKKHLKNAHKPGVLTCGDCGRTFPRSGAFEAHSQMHAVRTCRTCGIQFTNRGCYRKHRSQCEPDAKPDKQTVPRNRRSNIRDPAKFICDYCNKEYRSRPQLKNHIIWIHMDVRPHQCQWCGKRFYTAGRLSEHKVVHTRERNFECDICGLKLVSKMAAVYHRRRHTGERPYKCEDCDERFISASRRSEHAKRRHNKGFRFPCTQCPSTFVRGHELKKHVARAHSLCSAVLKFKDEQSEGWRLTQV